MKKLLLVPVVMACMVTGVSAQSAGEKAESIAAAFRKEKNKQKEKDGEAVHKDKAVEVIPDIRDDPSAYNGDYEIQGMGQLIFIHWADQKWEIVFYTKDKRKHGILTDIKVESGLISGRLRHPDGKMERFEAAFLLRSENGEKSYGIGLKQLLSLPDGFVVDKAFYRKVD